MECVCVYVLERRSNGIDECADSNGTVAFVHAIFPIFPYHLMYADYVFRN